MKAANDDEKPRRWSARRIALVVVGAGVAALLAANAHLVYVAFNSQPDCVAHIKPGAHSVHDGAYSAARSGC